MDIPGRPSQIGCRSYQIYQTFFVLYVDWIQGLVTIFKFLQERDDVPFLFSSGFLKPGRIKYMDSAIFFSFTEKPYSFIYHYYLALVHRSYNVLTYLKSIPNCGFQFSDGSQIRSLSEVKLNMSCPCDSRKHRAFRSVSATATHLLFPPPPLALINFS